MWTGPVYFQNRRWPTHEHAIVVVKLDKSSHLDSEEIWKLVLKCPDGFQAKCLGRRHSVHCLIEQWHNVRSSTVFDILMSAAFTNAQFLSCLLDPNIKEFHHVLPHGYRNPYWATPGKNIHGILLAGVRKAIIMVATQLHHFLHRPYVVPDLGHYLPRKECIIRSDPIGCWCNTSITLSSTSHRPEYPYSTSHKASTVYTRSTRVHRCTVAG